MEANWQLDLQIGLKFSLVLKVSKESHTNTDKENQLHHKQQKQLFLRQHETLTSQDCLIAFEHRLQ